MSKAERKERREGEERERERGLRSGAGKGGEDRAPPEGRDCLTSLLLLLPLGGEGVSTQHREDSGGLPNEGMSKQRRDEKPSQITTL